MASSSYTLKQRNQIILAIIIILSAIILFGLRFIMDGLLGAIIIYLIFRPLNILLQEKKKWNSSLSTALILLLSLVCLVMPVFFLVNMIFNQVMFYVENPIIIEQMLSNINKFASEQFNEPDFTSTITENLKEGIGGAASSIVSTAASTFIQIIVMYFTLFFTIKNFRAFEKGVMKFMPFRASNTERLGHELRNMTYSNILGQGIIAIIQGTLLGIGFWIFGIANPLFWGGVGIFLSMVPLFGSPLIFVPAGIISISNGDNFAGFGIIIYGYALVTLVDNFIRMAFGKKIANTHPLITIIGVVIGVPLFGVLGILYGPFLLTSFAILIEIYQANRAELAKHEGIDEQID